MKIFQASNIFLWIMTSLYFLAAIQDLFFGDRNRAGVFLGYGFSNLFLIRMGYGN